MSNRVELFRLLDDVDYKINAAVVGDDTGKLLDYAREYAKGKNLKCVRCETMKIQMGNLIRYFQH
jgi:hypothetical protein